MNDDRRDNDAAVRLVIFDCDGVLVDSETISSEVLARVVSEAGAPTTQAEARRRYQGLMLADIGADVARRLGGPLPADFFERFDSERRRAFETSLRPVEGAAETIAAVQAAGIRTCVASQGRLAKTELTLGLTGLRPAFADDELFSAYQVPRGKPFPDLFLHAATSLGFAPKECLVVEDSPSGIAAAQAAAMRVVGYESVASDDEAPGRHALPDGVPVIIRLPDLLAHVLEG